MKQLFILFALLLCVAGFSQTSNVTANRIRAIDDLRVGVSASQKVTGFDTVMPAIPTHGKLPTTKCVFDWVTGSAVLQGAAAGGDLSGTYPSPMVDGLQGLPISAAAPGMGQVLTWSGSQWVSSTPVDGSATNEIQTLSISGSDLTLSGGGGTVALPGGGGGGSSDFLGTGFDGSGGGGGNIPNQTVINLNHMIWQTALRFDDATTFGQEAFPFSGFWAQGNDGTRLQWGYYDGDDAGDRAEFGMLAGTIDPDKPDLSRFSKFTFGKDSIKLSACDTLGMAARAVGITADTFINVRSGGSVNIVAVDTVYITAGDSLKISAGGTSVDISDGTIKMSGGKGVLKWQPISDSDMAVLSPTDTAMVIYNYTKGFFAFYDGLNWIPFTTGLKKGSVTESMSASTTITVSTGGSFISLTPSIVAANALSANTPHYIDNITAYSFDIVFTSPVTGTASFKWLAF